MSELETSAAVADEAQSQNSTPVKELALMSAGCDAPPSVGGLTDPSWTPIPATAYCVAAVVPETHAAWALDPPSPPSEVDDEPPPPGPG